MQRCRGGIRAGGVILYSMSRIPKSLSMSSLPALALAAAGRKLKKLTGLRLFKRVPVSFGGVRMYLTPEGSDGFTFWAEMFDLNPYPTLAVKCEGADLLIDCGGNTGAVTCAVLCRHRGLRAIAFEPNPPTFSRMQANCALNGLSDRVTLLQKAVGATTGMVALEIDPANSMAVIEGSAMGGGAGERLEMPITTVDAAVAGSQPPPQRIVMKIDVEGFEVEVLKGCTETLRRTSHVVLECHSESLLAECRALLKGAGFHCESKALEKGFFGLYADRI